MLMLTRKIGESFVIQSPHGDITVTVCAGGRGQCRIGITAPVEVPVMREELLPAERRDEIRKASQEGRRNDPAH